MTSRDLRGEVRVWLAHHGEGSVELIARGVKARVSEVRIVLLGAGFVRDQSAFDRHTGPVVFKLAFFAGDGQTAARRPSQWERVLAILSDGGWHSRAEFFAAGVGQPNSRLSDLRTPEFGSHEIQKQYADGGWVYRLTNGPIPSSEGEPSGHGNRNDL